MKTGICEKGVITPLSSGKGICQFLAEVVQRLPMGSEKTSSLRNDIFDSCREYFRQTQGPKSFVAGETYIPVTAKSLDADDLVHLVDASLDLWLTAGRFARELEAELPKQFGRSPWLTPRQQWIERQSRSGDELGCRDASFTQDRTASSRR